MRVSSPWHFHSKNFHLRLKLDSMINLEKRFSLNSNDYFTTDTNEILITFSDVVSSINETDKIYYHEVIIKCKVQYKNQTYYYPIITFVDHAYSIIRGYYLGFEKYISQIGISKKSICVNNGFVNFFADVEKTENDNYQQFNTYPFILFRNWKFDDEIMKNDIVTLSTRDYVAKEVASFNISQKDLNKILDEIEINPSSVNEVQKFYVEDEFVLDGVTVI